MRAVNHVTSQCKSLDGLVNHIMDRVHIRVRTLEGRITVVAGCNCAADDGRSLERLREALDLHVAEGLVLEFVGELRGCLAVTVISVTVLELVSEILRISMIEIIIEEADHLAFLHDRHINLHETHEGMAHVIDICAVRHLMDGDRPVGLIKDVRLAHLRSRLMGRDIAYYNVLPIN